MGLFTRSCAPLVTVVALVASAAAQTYTSCNPLNGTCPADEALGTTFNQTFNSDSSLSTDYWNVTGAPAPDFPSDNSGMAFTITSKGEAPTMNTMFYVFGGHVEVIMKAAPGQGIISSIVLLSDDLDEIDWEIMGGNSSFVETNYFGKGNVSENNAIWYPASAATIDGFHNYTLNWNESHIDWLLDGELVRSLPASKAVLPNGVTTFPQTPMQLRLGNWAAGSTGDPGTVEWAGGVTDFTKGPFTMMVQEVKITDGVQNATSYSFKDTTGSWNSIDVTSGTSKAASKINALPPPSLQDRWASYSKTKQIIIIACAAAGAVLIFLIFAWCCCCSRCIGKKKRAERQQMWNKEQVELLEYNRMNTRGFGPQPIIPFNGQQAGQPYRQPSPFSDNDNGPREKQGFYSTTTRLA